MVSGGFLHPNRMRIAVPLGLRYPDARPYPFNELHHSWWSDVVSTDSARHALGREALRRKQEPLRESLGRGQRRWP